MRVVTSNVNEVNKYILNACTNGQTEASISAQYEATMDSKCYVNLDNKVT